MTEIAKGLKEKFFGKDDIRNSKKVGLNRDTVIATSNNSLERLIDAYFDFEDSELLNITKKSLYKSVIDKITESKLKKFTRAMLRPIHFIKETSDQEVSRDVYYRLLLRHSILYDLENIERKYSAHKSLGKDQNSNSSCKCNELLGAEYKPTIKDNDKNGSPDLRAYRLAATDLFVEKAIAYLESDYTKYSAIGKTLFVFGIASVIFGVYASFVHFSDNSAKTFAYNTQWVDFFYLFSKGFTFYGFLVLHTVLCWRYGKAMMDQAERLRERRHSLRQGRLFVHLNDGNISIQEMEKAFEWNVSKGNAFGNIPTEASAPWGGVLKELANSLPEMIKNTKERIKPS